MRPLILAVVVVGGCSHGAPPKTIANHQENTPLVCTPEVIDRLTHVLAERWDIPALSLRCTAGQFRTAGFFIEGQINGLRRIGIVDASGTELVPFVDEAPEQPFTFVVGYRTADLDHDGEDEIIESWRRSHQAVPTEMFADSWLVVRVVSGKRLLKIKGPYVSRSHPELGACFGTWQLRPGAIDLAISVLPGIPPSDCLPAGRHRFLLRGHALVDASRALRR